MSRLIILAILAAALTATLASRYPIVEVPERVDDAGQRWVGPLPLLPVGGTDEEYNAWTVNVIKKLKPTIARGFPEYGFPQVDPFKVSKFEYQQNFGPVSVKLFLKDVRIQGFSEFSNLVLTFDTKNKTMRFTLDVPHMLINTVYKAGGNAVLFPITGSGPAVAKLADLHAEGYMAFSIFKREDGVEVVQVDKTVIEDLKFGNIFVRITGLFNGNPLLSAVIHYFVNNFGPQIFDGILRQELSARIADTATQDVVNPFIYNIPQFVPYIKK